MRYYKEDLYRIKDQIATLTQINEKRAKWLKSDVPIMKEYYTKDIEDRKEGIEYLKDKVDWIEKHWDKLPNDPDANECVCDWGEICFIHNTSILERP